MFRVLPRVPLMKPQDPSDLSLLLPLGKSRFVASPLERSISRVAILASPLKVQSILHPEPNHCDEDVVVTEIRGHDPLLQQSQRKS